jgi:hypothetical protein
LGKGRATTPHAKESFLGHGFSFDWDGQLFFKFHIEKDGPPIYRTMPGTLGFISSIPTFKDHSNQLLFWDFV